MKLKFQTAAGALGGFVAEVDGFLCFITPEAMPDQAGGIYWKYSIQSGGGWTHRGGETVTTHAEGGTFSAIGAEEAIVEELAQLGAAF